MRGRVVHSSRTPPPAHCFRYEKVEMSYKDLASEEVVEYPKFRLPEDGARSEDEKSEESSADEFEGLQEHVSSRCVCVCARACEVANEALRAATFVCTGGSGGGKSVENSA